MSETGDLVSGMEPWHIDLQIGNTYFKGPQAYCP